MTYQQTIDYLYSQLPMFSNIGKSAVKKGLDNIIQLCAILGNPQEKFRSIHIAGTNGKGSVSHMLASILYEQGYKTGLYTSPHLIDFRERIRINGKMVSKKWVINFVQTLQPAIEAIQPSFFEITVAMAFAYFAEKKVAVAVIETGLGGRLDSTNIITPVLSVITNISLDHKDMLGDTLQAIAAEKAGIIKRQIPVIIGRKQAETTEVFTQTAKSCNSPLFFSEDMIEEKSISRRKNLLVCKYNMPKIRISSPLLAVYQQENIKTVVSAVNLLPFPIDTDSIKNGIKHVIDHTGLMARWQIIGTSPNIIADVGHNEDGILHVMEQLKQEKYRQLHIIFGAVKDKDVPAVLKLLPSDAKYYLTEADIPRKLPVAQLSEMAKSLQLNFKIFSTPKKALKSAKSHANKKDLILCVGSFFIVKDII
ncbi:MAG: bifunctional folylpolyglutamate synthase/dihydrofolate synthase [Chitinophagales bacterium]|nr:bifunctional folylpolyglutamate synthase/dihydrofolate synthase [Chitinophagales bacterium]